MTLSAFVPYQRVSTHSTMMYSLPSPPLSNQQKPTLIMDRVRSFDTRSTDREAAELRPFLYNHNKSESCLLPPIQAMVMNAPYPSPSPPTIADNYFGYHPSSPSSSEDEEEDLQQHYRQQQQMDVRRKGSIASLLNSDPELKRLDSDRFGFLDTLPSLKRGRPKHDDMIDHQQKKQCIVQQEDSDCVQTCHSGLTLKNTISPRATKGLRHFSKQVCDKVAEKGVTSYNEVADELAFDIQNSTERNQNASYDQKNIRRRVYDALNVLMAMDIISKDKKIIKWLGIPECYQQNVNTDKEQTEKSLLEQIEQEQNRQAELAESLRRLRESVNSKIQKRLNIRNLILRNQNEQKNHTLTTRKDSEKIVLPFFLISCASKDNVSINLSIDKRSASLSFQQDTFQLNKGSKVYEDTDILNCLRSSNSALCSS
ncbi:Transcription factor Dp-2 [Choanephora cucurbitarum]|uniref:Transcription factor Dp-2 n=1 Tax=Choanephora cucurbitarum TaxID=101091 RepID=A0A1C7NS20_9FUNG|nr:Transcription factor Dp-2 [Choanephora cucurbitarum]